MKARTVLWIGLCGAAGACTRYLGLAWLASRLSSPFPWPTLVINLTGSFLLGLVTGLGVERGLIPPAYRAPITAGYIGAYTTFSTWAVESMKLISHGHWLLATGNVLVSVGLGLPAVWLGLASSKLRR
ncbi:MAG: fluoride efflux transporter FluC [Mycobacterium leprae]